MTKNTNTNSTETKKVPVTLSPIEAMRKAISAGKSFCLYRSVYKSSRTDQYYFEYRAIIELSNARQKYYQITLLPDIGYVGKDTSASQVRSLNSSAYRSINLFYDLGVTLKLIAKEEVDKREQPVFNFYAVAVDESGVSVEMPMRPRNPGDARFLQAAFCGFGKSREVDPEKVAEDEDLRAIFEEIYLPGQYPKDIDVQDDVE